MTGEGSIIAMRAVQMLEAFSIGTLSPVEVMKAHLAQYEKKNPIINAVFDVQFDYALEQARKSEHRWMKASPLGPLDGVPVVLKDSIQCMGFRYYHGSASYDGTAAQADGLPAERIKSAGGLVFGKTTMPDYGMLAAGVSSVFGIIRNPWDPEKNTGGSSSGSGAALAAGIAPLAVGTDIAGSVRLPCAHNGLVGLKPSRGRVPHLQPSPIRAAGPMARTVDDTALLMSVLVLPDERDFESAPPCNEKAFCRLSDTPDNFLAGKTIGMMLHMGFGQEPEDRILDLIRHQGKLLQSLGAHVELMPAVARFDPMDALYTLIQSRAFYELMGRPEKMRTHLLPHVLDWCLKTKNKSAHDLSTALFQLEDFKTDVMKAMAPYDYVISPALTVVSFPAEHVGAIQEDHFAHCAYQIPFNQTGAPALSINAGFIDGLPVGMQIAGKRYDDLGVLKVAKLYEQHRTTDINWPM